MPTPSDQNSRRSGSARPLDGIRVLDVSTVIAAPLTAMILADFGADVIKIEHPTGGDPARSHGYKREGVSLWSLMLSRNKRSVTLYLGAEEDRSLFRELARSADVVIENFRPGTMERWGLGYEALKADNPGLIVAHISGFGRTGPLKDEPGFGTLAETLSGFAFRNGYPDGPPTLPPFGLADGVAGITAALAVLTALYERERSAQGQEIDLGIIEPLLTLLEPQLTTQDQIGKTLQRTGNHAEMNAPRGLYRTRDGEWVAISASTVRTASRLLHLVGSPELTEQPWFAGANGRQAHSEEIDTVLVPWFAEHDRTDAIERCREAGVPVAPVNSAADILEDPQYEALGSVATVEHPILGPVRMPNVLFRLSRTPGRIDWPGPELGQDTEEVLTELGVAAERIQTLLGRRTP